ncbi:hypothetical protein VNO78_06713 [Psophocarpus tetragonolobus]|uniref:Uncharacterized protein n=1 Tax=Psophocarpus tetragonolobus TaxID=3891 RepID=A0AAN9XS18_PSOTE
MPEGVSVAPLNARVVGHSAATDLIGKQNGKSYLSKGKTVVTTRGSHKRNHEETTSDIVDFVNKEVTPTTSEGRAVADKVNSLVQEDDEVGAEDDVIEAELLPLLCFVISFCFAF